MAPARQPRGGGAAHRARRVPSTHAFDAADGARPAPAAAPSGPAAGRPDRSSRRPPWPAGTARRRDAVTMLRQRYDLRQWGKQDGVRRGRKNARPRYRGGRGYVHPAAPMATRARRRGVSRALRTSRKLPLLLVTHGQIGKVPALVGAREAALARPSGPGGGGGGGARRGRSTADTHEPRGAHGLRKPPATRRSHGGERAAAGCAPTGRVGSGVHAACARTADPGAAPSRSQARPQWLTRPPRAPPAHIAASLRRGAEAVGGARGLVHAHRRCGRRVCAPQEAPGSTRGSAQERVERVGERAAAKNEVRGRAGRACATPEPRVGRRAAHRGC